MIRHALFWVLAAGTAGTVHAQVTFERLLNADEEPENWLTYSGNYDGQRYSPLAQVDRGNVQDLEIQWVYQARSLEKYETTALVVDGVLYTIQAPNDVIALDAATGRPIWTHPYQNAPEGGNCCGRVNRGLAISGNTLLMGTLDAHLVAIDAQTGDRLWRTEVAPASERYAITHAPLVIKNMALVGTAGGDRGIRGLLAAYDVDTGEEVWRFHTIPAPGEPGNETWIGTDPDSGRAAWEVGGAAIWNTGAYDPETNLTFWGTGNPWPDWDGRDRLGDNLYSDSVVAVDADTGELRWYYQFTPHDEMDYDATQVPVLADVEWEGELRRVMLWANRNGLMYMLDRVTGEFLYGQPFVQVNWTTGFDSDGRPILNPDAIPRPDEPVLVMPTVLGATNWYPPSYSPVTGLFYVPAWENTGTMATQGVFPRATDPTPMGNINISPNMRAPLSAGEPFEELLDPADGQDYYGAVRAFDPATGDLVWQHAMNDITWAGVLSTASNLVFSGGREGYFYALDAETGELLWRISLGGQVNSGPMTYMVDGRQYVAVAAGTGLFAFALE